MASMSRNPSRQQSVAALGNAAPKSSRLLPGGRGETNLASLWNYTEAGYSRILKSLKSECIKEDIQPPPEFTIEAFGWIRVLCTHEQRKQIVLIWQQVATELEEEHIDSFPGGERDTLNSDGSLKTDAHSTYTYGPRRSEDSCDPLAPGTKGAREAADWLGFPPEFDKFAYRKKWRNVENENEEQPFKAVVADEEVNEMNRTGQVMVSHNLPATFAFVGAETETLLQQTLKKLDNALDRYRTQGLSARHCFMVDDQDTNKQQRKVDLRYMIHIQDKQLTTTLLHASDYNTMYKGGARGRMITADAKTKKDVSLFGPKIKVVQPTPAKCFTRERRPAVVPKTKTVAVEDKQSRENSNKKAGTKKQSRTSHETVPNEIASPHLVTKPETSAPPDDTVAPDIIPDSGRSLANWPVLGSPAVDLQSVLGELRHSPRIPDWVMDVPDVLEPMPLPEDDILRTTPAPETVRGDLMDMDMDPADQIAFAFMKTSKSPQKEDLDDVLQTPNFQKEAVGESSPNLLGTASPEKRKETGRRSSRDLLGDGSPEKREIRRLAAPVTAVMSSSSRNEDNAEVLNRIEDLNFGSEVEIGTTDHHVVGGNMNHYIDSDRPIPRQLLRLPDLQPPQPPNPGNQLINLDETFAHFHPQGRRVHETMRQRTGKHSQLPQASSKPKGSAIPHLTLSSITKLFARAPWFRGMVTFTVDIGKIILICNEIDQNAMAKNSEDEKDETNPWPMADLRESLNKFYIRSDKTIFTRILTTHDSDVGALVDATVGKSANNRLWASAPESVRTMYSFTCKIRGEDDGEFLVNIEYDEKKMMHVYSIRAAVADGTIWVHSLTNTWDFGMRLNRAKTTQVSQQLHEFAQKLVASFTVKDISKHAGKPVYECAYDVPREPKIDVTDFQIITKLRYLGTDNSTALDIVEKLQMERLSDPVNSSPEEAHWVAREWPPQLVALKRAMGSMPFWYEASLSSLELEKILSANESLGVLERASWTDSTLCGPLMDLYSQAVRVIKAMDDVGAGEDNGQMRKLEKTMPPPLKRLHRFKQGIPGNI